MPFSQFSARRDGSARGESKERRGKKPRVDDAKRRRLSARAGGPHGWEYYHHLHHYRPCESLLCATPRLLRRLRRTVQAAGGVGGDVPVDIELLERAVEAGEERAAPSATPRGRGAAAAGLLTPSPHRAPPAGKTPKTPGSAVSTGSVDSWAPSPSAGAGTGTPAPLPAPADAARRLALGAEGEYADAEAAARRDVSARAARWFSRVLVAAAPPPDAAAAASAAASAGGAGFFARPVDPRLDGADAGAGVSVLLSPSDARARRRGPRRG